MHFHGWRMVGGGKPHSKTKVLIVICNAAVQCSTFDLVLVDEVTALRVRVCRVLHVVPDAMDYQGTIASIFHGVVGGDLMPIVEADDEHRYGMCDGMGCVSVKWNDSHRPTTTLHTDTQKRAGCFAPS